MALSIKSERADLLARELAELTGETLVEVVTRALEERLERCRARRGPSLAEDLRAIRERCSRLPVLDARHPDDILGYDENGIPT